VQHTLDNDYFNRMDALNYAIGHDDGQGGQDLDQADVILVGVSRTSKTPTCIYLAHRGVRAANVPLVPGRPIPDKLLDPRTGHRRGPDGVRPDRLIQIRRNRLLSLKGKPGVRPIPMWTPSATRSSRPGGFTKSTAGR